MGFWSWAKSKFSKKRDTTTTTEVAPAKADPVRSIDYGSDTQDRVGGVTVSGSNVWTSKTSSNSGGGGGGSSTPVTVISTDFSEADTTKKVTALGFSKVNTLKPSNQTSNQFQNPQQYNALTPSPDPSLSQRPYTLGDDLTTKEKIKLRTKKYGDVNFYKGVLGTSFGAGTYKTSNYPNPIGALAMLYPSLPKKYRERKGDDPINIPYSGTKVYDPNLKKWTNPDPNKNKTGWERIQEREIIAKGIETGTGKQVQTELTPNYEAIINKRSKTYQNLVNSGDLTLEKAQSSLDLDVKGLQTRYNIDAQNLYSTKLKKNKVYSQVGNWTKDFGSAVEFKKDFSGVATTGGLIAGSFVAPVLIGGVIATSGFGMGYEGISEKNTGKVIAGFGMGALGVYGSSRALANQITKYQVEDVLATKPKIVSSKRLQGGDISLDFYKTTQRTSNAYSYSEGWIGSKVTGKQINILGGKSNTIVYTKDYWTGQPLLTGGSQNIMPSSGSFYPNLATKGFTPSRFSLSTSPSYDYSLLSLKRGGVKTNYNIYSGSVKTVKYGGVSKQTGNNIISYSGKMRDNYADIFIDTNKRTVNIVDKGLKFNVDNVGITKVFDPSKAGGSFSFSPSSSSGLKANLLSKGTGLVSSFKAPSIKTFAKPSIVAGSSTTLKSVVGSVGGLKFAGATSVTTVPRSSVRTNVKPVFFSSQTLSQVPKTIPSSGSVISPAVIYNTNTSQNVALSPIQIPKIAQQPRIITKLVSPPLAGLTGGTVTPNLSYAFKLPRVILPILPPIRMDAGKLGKRRIPIRKIVKYTPSYSALVYNIRGNKPKGIETGLRLRPIPKGFSFNKMFGGSKIKRIIKIPKITSPIYSGRKRVIKKRQVKRRTKK